jgi:hypothetical protein
MFKGFSVMKTANIYETAGWLWRSWKKYKRISINTFNWHTPI